MEAGTAWAGTDVVVVCVAVLRHNALLNLWCPGSCLVCTLRVHQWFRWMAPGGWRCCCHSESGAAGVRVPLEEAEGDCEAAVTPSYAGEDFVKSLTFWEMVQCNQVNKLNEPSTEANIKHVAAFVLLLLFLLFYYFLLLLFVTNYASLRLNVVFHMNQLLKPWTF